MHPAGAAFAFSYKGVNSPITALSFRYLEGQLQLWRRQQER
jgi:hypothetical protein